MVNWPDILISVLIVYGLLRLELWLRRRLIKRIKPFLKPETPPPNVPRMLEFTIVEAVKPIVCNNCGESVTSYSGFKNGLRLCFTCHNTAR